MKKIFLSLILSFVMVTGMVTLNSSVSYAKDIKANIVTPNAEACPYYGSSHVFETVETYETYMYRNHFHETTDADNEIVYEWCKITIVTTNIVEECACGRTRTLRPFHEEHSVN